jgi:hypothetical protein
LLAEVPWLYRASLGRRSAFVATVRMVLVDPGRLAEQCHREVYVEPVGTASFWRACIVIAATSVALLALLLAIPSPPVSPAKQPAVLPLLAGVAGVAAAAFFFVASVPLDTGPFDSCARNVRFRRLHDFTCAPLVLMLLAPLAYGLLWCTGAGTSAAERGGVGTVILVMLAWLAYRSTFQRHAGDRSVAWVIGHALLTLLFWPFLGLFCMVMGAVLLNVTLELLPHR